MANANAASTGAEPIDSEAAGANFKMQFMFVVAFIVNAFAVYWFTRRWLADQITLGFTLIALIHRTHTPYVTLRTEEI